jgi:hypothetical protein
MSASIGWRCLRARLGFHPGLPFSLLAAAARGFWVHGQDGPMQRAT